MKSATIKSLRELAKITGEKCAKCPTLETYRCCDAYFCGMAKPEMESLGVSIPEVEDGPLPYMGPTGCVVPPEYRPGCSGFVCPQHLGDAKFRTKYLSLIEKVRSDGAIRRAMKMPSTLCKAILEEESKFIDHALKNFPV